MNCIYLVEVKAAYYLACRFFVADIRRARISRKRRRYRKRVKYIDFSRFSRSQFIFSQQVPLAELKICVELIKNLSDRASFSTSLTDNGNLFRYFISLLISRSIPP